MFCHYLQRCYPLAVPQAILKTISIPAKNIRHFDFEV